MSYLSQWYKVFKNIVSKWYFWTNLLLRGQFVNGDFFLSYVFIGSVFNAGYLRHNKFLYIITITLIYHVYVKINSSSVMYENKNTYADRWHYNCGNHTDLWKTEDLCYLKIKFAKISSGVLVL